MTKKPDSKTESMEISEEEVVAYLEQHPEFLLKREGLLKRLHIPHNPGGGAASLIERQVELLRASNRDMEDRLAILVNNARINEELAEKLHRYGLLLSGTESIDEITDSAMESLQQMFDLDAVSVHIKPEFLNDNFKVPEIGDKAYSALQDTLGKDSCSCHKELDDELLTSLFAEQAAGIKSCALLALDVPHRVGLIALGSGDRDRFAPQMGTMLLSLLGEQFSTALKRHHAF